MIEFDTRTQKTLDQDQDQDHLDHLLSNYDWHRNPLRRCLDRLAHLPGFFTPAPAPAQIVTRPSSTAVSVSVSASVLNPSARVARRIYERVCPLLGFSTLTGLFCSARKCNI
ncbi:hypothetical protein F5B21DRAFT_493814 [Xylaria acuta]|nr:hypothetical protein F5B21DRAFT_493814 [Xylaria acuta]